MLELEGGGDEVEVVCGVEEEVLWCSEEVGESEWVVEEGGSYVVGESDSVVEEGGSYVVGGSEWVVVVGGSEWVVVVGGS